MIKTLSLAIATLLVVSSYVYFSSFKPKLGMEAAQVQGASTTTTAKGLAVPLPLDINIINEDTTTNSRKVTFTTTKSSAEISTYYETALLSDGWLLDYKTTEGASTTAQYKKEDIRFSITTVAENGIVTAIAQTTI